eukprot:942129-Prymnesium_polylepis.1
MKRPDQLLGRGHLRSSPILLCVVIITGAKLARDDCTHNYQSIHPVVVWCLGGWGGGAHQLCR